MRAISKGMMGHGQKKNVSVRKHEQLECTFVMHSAAGFNSMGAHVYYTQYIQRSTDKLLLSKGGVHLDD